MPHLFASLESILVFVAIVLISAVSNWLKQRQERKQAEAQGESAPLRPRPAIPNVFDDQPKAPAAPRPLDWQEELRRLLEGDERKPVSPPSAASPQRTPPRPMPVFDDESPVKPDPVLARAGGPVTVLVETESEGPSGSGPGRLQESAAAFLRGNQLGDAVESRLQAVASQVATARVSRALARSGNATETANRLKAQLRNPVAVRQAILAAVVLGPPRGLEQGLPSHG